MARALDDALGHAFTRVTDAQVRATRQARIDAWERARAHAIAAGKPDPGEHRFVRWARERERA